MKPAGIVLVQQQIPGQFVHAQLAKSWAEKGRAHKAGAELVAHRRPGLFQGLDCPFRLKPKALLEGQQVGDLGVHAAAPCG